MKNLRLTLTYLLLGYILPLLPQTNKLLHYKTGILVFACIIMLSWANPEISLSEGKNNEVSDKGTVLVIFLMGYVAVVSPVIEWGYFLIDRGLTFWTFLGITLITTGLSYRIYAIQILGRQFTGAVKKVTGHQLITDGPYRLIRHPSYLGSLIAFAGCAVLLEAWIGLIICVVAMMIAYFFRITAEERHLVSIFRDDYTTYQKTTWRLFPFVW